MPLRRTTALAVVALTASVLAPASVAAQEPDPDGLTLACDAPDTITEGFAATDGAFARGKALTGTATGGSGDYLFEVVDVDPDPTSGQIAVASSDGGDVEVRVSDDVPGLDPSVEDGPTAYTVAVEVTDANDEDSRATCTEDVTIVPNLDIGTLRGEVPDDVDGRAHVSPYALGSPIFQPGPPIAVTGVVTQRTLEEGSSGADVRGFFLQSLDPGPAGIDGIDEDDPALADGVDRTSDGLFVSTGSFSTLRLDEPGTTAPEEQYLPVPGDVITIRGGVVEDFQQTQMNNPFVVDVRTAAETGVDVDADIRVPVADPPDDVQQASVYWERIAGMQTEVAADAVVVSGNEVFSPSTSEFWVIDGDHPVAQRDDPAARRVFRDYHPLANGGPFDLTEGPGDQNGYRILLGSFGVKATADDATERITPVRTGDTLTEARQGGLFFAFSKYQIMVDTQPDVARGPDPAASSLSIVDDFTPDDEYSVMVYNVENLYDFRSDPFSGCDLDPDVVPDGQQPTSTCTADEDGGGTTSPPFTYAPRDQTAYDEQRGAIANQIADALQAPDVVTIQEAEKQDVCSPVFDVEVPDNSTMDCDLSAPAEGETASDNERGSGAPDTVEELALEIFVQTDGEVRYEASGDSRNGRDLRGITQGFLHRVDRVELVDVAELTDDPILGAADAVDIAYPEADDRTGLAPWVLDAANPKAINAELPQPALDAAEDLGESIDGGRFPVSQYVFSRAVQVAKFRIFPDGIDGDAEPVERYVTSNHMSAGPDNRTAQRTEQSRLNAAVAEAARDAGGQVLVTGDFNVFPRPDDPFPAFKTDPDRAPSDQLAAMYQRGFANLHDVILAEDPANTFSFIFRGVSQILDHIFVDEVTLDELVVARYIHVNVDFPADTPGFEEGRGASDHDPLYARFGFGTGAATLTCPDGEGSGFPDVPDESVHADNIRCGADLGIFTGKLDGSFDPRGSLTRGQAATVLDRIATALGRPIDGERRTFSDVSGTYVHRDAIERLGGAGVLAGSTDGTFRPQEPIARDQLASVVVRFVERVSGEDLPLGDPFADVPAENVHAENLRKARAAGIVIGTEDGNALPRRDIRRDQAASLFVRSLDWLPIAD